MIMGNGTSPNMGNYGQRWGFQRADWDFTGQHWVRIQGLPRKDQSIPNDTQKNPTITHAIVGSQQQGGAGCAAWRGGEGGQGIWDGTAAGGLGQPLVGYGRKVDMVVVPNWLH